MTREVPVRLRLLEVSGTEHVLVVVAHHIAADGFSMVPLTRDVVTAYAARSDGRTPGWAPLEVQYADFSLWQRSVLGSENDPESLISAQETFWKTTLADLPDQLDLPSDRRRPAVATGRGATTRTLVDGAVRRRIEKVAADHSATPFMVVHAALSVLLARLSGTDDIPVGTPVAGRGEQVLDDLVGMFVNTLVLRTKVRAGQDFTDLLRSVRRIDLDAFGSADVPFERLVEVLDPARSRSRHPLFQVLLVFQNLGDTTLELPGLTVSGVDFDTAVAKMDLQVTVSDHDSNSGSGWALDFTYATDLFDANTVDIMANRLLTVLDAVGTDPSCMVGDIELVEPSERSRVLTEWNDTTHDVADRLLLDAFHRTATRTPESVALTFEDERLTYGEFASRVAQLARELINHGVGPEQLVAVAMRRSLDMLVALYAVIEAGGGYVPIDPDQPADRNTYILDTSAASIVLTTSRDDVDAGGREVLIVDTLDLSGYDRSPVVDAERTQPL
ncbi:MAG: condensation domain-containing protein, partial [Rhodococcus sp. (in: high G+C Gram-positive bacteria)]